MIEHLLTYEDLLTNFLPGYNASRTQLNYAIDQLGITVYKKPNPGYKPHNAIVRSDFRKLNQWFHEHETMTEDETVGIINKLLNAGENLSQSDIARHLKKGKSIVSLWKSRDRQITRGDYERLQLWHQNIVNGK